MEVLPKNDSAVPDRFAQIESLSRLLDTSIPLGRSGFRIGLDPLIGLIPGIGDAIGALLSGYIVLQAAYLGASRWLLIRMLGNIGIETLLGVIPVFGDLFDFVFKANQKNVALLRKAPLLIPTADGKRRLGTSLLMISGIFLVIFCIVIYLSVRTLAWIFSQA